MHAQLIKESCATAREMWHISCAKAARPGCKSRIEGSTTHMFGASGQSAFGVAHGIIYYCKDI